MKVLVRGGRTSDLAQAWNCEARLCVGLSVRASQINTSDIAFDDRLEHGELQSELEQNITNRRRRSFVSQKFVQFDEMAVNRHPLCTRNQCWAVALERCAGGHQKGDAFHEGMKLCVGIVMVRVIAAGHASVARCGRSRVSPTHSQRHAIGSSAAPLLPKARKCFNIDEGIRRESYSCEMIDLQNYNLAQAAYNPSQIRQNVGLSDKSFADQGGAKGSNFWPAADLQVMGCVLARTPHIAEPDAGAAA